MAVRDWHYGKLVMLWAWGVILMFLSLQLLRSLSDAQSLMRLAFGSLMIATVIGIPIVLSAITWRWLTGKETR
jgi:hypothetical protein